MWWINWPVYLCLLPILLLCPFGYVWLHANLVLLRLHGLHLLWLLSHARDGGFPCCFALCSPHLQVNQVWVRRWSIMLIESVPVSSSASGRKVYDFCYVVGYKSALRSQESKLPLNLFFWNLCLCVCFRAWKLLGSTYVDCMYTTLMWRTDCTTTFYLTPKPKRLFLVSKSNQYFSFAPIFSCFKEIMLTW